MKSRYKNCDLKPRPSPALLSLVIPVFNEQESLPSLRACLEELAVKLPCPVEWLLVNDGSRDDTSEILLEWAGEDSRAKVLELARNFGHQAALTAGLDHAAGDAVVIMDADLQDPPELILDMLDRYRQGYDIVLAQRTKRHGETFFKKASAAAFYWVMRQLVHKELPVNTGDFRLISRQVVDALGHLREGQRFLRGMVTWIGFPTTVVLFERPPRVAGETKYSLYKMVQFGWDAIISFSSGPLRLSAYFGLLVFLFGLFYGLYAFLRALIFHDLVPGWATLVILQSLIGGTILICLGMIGEYVGRIYEEIKERPIYIMRRGINILPRTVPRRGVSTDAMLDIAEPAVAKESDDIKY